jgi:hypothetical protein
VTLAVRGMSCSSMELGSATGVCTIVTISVPPEVSLTHDVSGRRARERASVRAVAGCAVSRTIHCVSPACAGSGRPTTRNPASARSRW